jgi:hypothetical protein
MAVIDEKVTLMRRDAACCAPEVGPGDGMVRRTGDLPLSGSTIVVDALPRGKRETPALAGRGSRCYVGPFPFTNAPEGKVQGTSSGTMISA